MSGLRLVPIDFETACALVRGHHRHHAPPVGHKFSGGLAIGDEMVGAIIVGRPVARHFDDGLTLEAIRCVVSDGIPNGCSLLYGAAWRAAAVRQQFGHRMPHAVADFFDRIDERTAGL